jgi:putative transposase
MKIPKLGNHCAYNVNYHIVFCPKYRKPILTNDLQEDLIKIIHDIAAKYEFKIETYEIMPDYIRLFISAKPNIAPHVIVKRLKGASSNFLRKKYLYVRTKMPCLWSSSYYIGTVGNVSESVVKLYIENQKRV